ncbi:MAG: hypothetical protein ACI9HU_001671, partial [Colwellia sp.]
MTLSSQIAVAINLVTEVNKVKKTASFTVKQPLT